VWFQCFLEMVKRVSFVFESPFSNMYLVFHVTKFTIHLSLVSLCDSLLYFPLSLLDFAPSMENTWRLDKQIQISMSNFT